MLGKQQRKILWWLILPVLVAGILIGIGSYFGEQMQYESRVERGEGLRTHDSGLRTREAGVRFGDVIVDPAAGEIRFYGEVRQNEGWVRFLVYLCSYRWLREEAAIVSLAYLVDLQMAIALLDWRLWDELWHRETTGQEIEVSLKWHGEEVNANELVQLPYRLGIGDLILLGSPLFDPLFLARCRQTIVCVALGERPQCPLFFLQESVEAKFVRACGSAGYQLTDDNLPPVGTKVTVIIRVPDLPGGE